MKNRLLLLVLFSFISCSEIEDDKRYRIQAKFLDLENQPISDVNVTSLRGNNFFSSGVILGNSVSDQQGKVEFTSLVPSGNYVTLAINSLTSIDDEALLLKDFSSLVFVINNSVLEETMNFNLGDFILHEQISFEFQLTKTSTSPAVINWQLIYQDSSFCSFDIETPEDLNQEFTCQNTNTINRTNDVNNPNENINLGINKNSLLTFIYSINGGENQVIEINPNTLNNNAFEFNY